MNVTQAYLLKYVWLDGPVSCVLPRCPTLSYVSSPALPSCPPQLSLPRLPRVLPPTPPIASICNWDRPHSPASGVRRSSLPPCHWGRELPKALKETCGLCLKSRFAWPLNGESRHCLNLLLSLCCHYTHPIIGRERKSSFSQILTSRSLRDNCNVWLASFWPFWSVFWGGKHTEPKERKIQNVFSASDYTTPFSISEEIRILTSKSSIFTIETKFKTISSHTPACWKYQGYILCLGWCARLEDKHLILAFKTTSSSHRVMKEKPRNRPRLY